MKKLFYSLFVLTILFTKAQIVTTNPEFPTGEDEITFTFDVSKAQDSRAAGLRGLTSGVYLWSGAGTTENGDAFEYEPNGQTNFNVAFEPGKMTFLGDDKWEIKLTPRSYFDVPTEKSIAKLGLLLKNASGSAQTEDIILQLRDADEFQISLNSPELPAFYNEGESFDIGVSASESSLISISIDGFEVASASASTSLVETVTATGSGDHSVVITANNGSETLEKSFSYLVRQTTEISTIPAGIVRGINYLEGDDSKVTLCLQAPGKSSVYVIGEFNDWTPQSDYQMKRDGELFWLEISGLSSGEEYAFQYLVDESIYIADPYCDKILHPLDEFISNNVYPNLKPYPQEASNPIGFYNTVSILQTGQQDYVWNVPSFQKPEPSELIIYELLVRDFFGNGEESYENLIDTLSYIKSLGVNAIELMPITEFSGNDSWGYNPTFMLAPDKAYGPKDDFKAFIDAAHGLGMAVILDMVLNQQEQPSPLVLLDFDVATSKVTADNPYFNIEATHPFNVFYDMNHESTYTQSFVDTVNHYWINEYKLDGYRFDLSKGFTQTNYGSNVGAWSGYDAGRITTLKRMSDQIWSHTPDAYVILEHFADNTEEKELAEYGMMLWGNMHSQYKENLLGFEGSKTDISGTYHINRNWTEPHLVGYMESHDEQRQMFEIKSFGNAITSYSTKETGNALKRLRSAFALLLTTPGPKMFWQFGELGYDIDIDENGRTGQKPTPWDNSEGLDYYTPNARQILRDYVSEIVQLRTTYDLFSYGTSSLSSSNSLIKQFYIETPSSTSSPSSSDEMSAVIVANFDLLEKEITLDMPFDGIWYNYFNTETVVASGGEANITLAPGDFRIFTNLELEKPDLVLSVLSDEWIKQDFLTYPNPTTNFVTIQSDKEPLYFFIYDLNGREIKRGKFMNREHKIDLQSTNSGTLIIEVITRDGERLIDKIIKK